jgi:hypothetical protein
VFIVVVLPVAPASIGVWLQHRSQGVPATSRG